MKLKKLYSFLTLLTAFLWLGTGTMWAYDPITVADGTTTNSYLPVYGWGPYYGDYEGQYIYPSTALSALPDAEITQLTFYTTSSYPNISWGTATFDVILSEISATSLSGIVEPSAPTTVYSGSLSVSGSEMVINFSEGYEYTHGNNLLVYIKETAGGSYNSAYFYGISSTAGSSYYSYSGGTTKSASAFLPKMKIVYGDVPSCKVPKNLAASSITSSSATISWNAGNTSPAETEWNLRYKKSTDDSWTTHNGLDATSFDMSGLDSHTTYNLQVQSVCSALDNSAWKSLNFTTPYGLPFSEDFNGITSGIPENWDNSDGNAGTYKWTYSASGNSGACVTMNSYNPQSGKYNLLKTPYVLIDGGAKLSFYYKNQNGGNLVVQYQIEGEDAVDLQTIGQKSSWTLINNITLPAACDGEKVRIIFKGISNYGTGSVATCSHYLDDVLLESTRDCSKPATPTYSDLTASSVTISWTANEGVTDYKYINVDRTANPTYVLDWTNDATSVSATSVDLTSLTDGHNYEFYVMCACGTEASDACEYQPLSCPNVTGVTLSNQVWNGVTVNWTTSATTNCDVQYKAGSGEWQTAETNTSATSKVISGLVPGTEYSFRVKPHCSADAWVSPASTYIPSCPTPGALTLSNQTYNGVTVSWDEIVGVGTWNLEYQQGDLGWVPVTANPLSTTTYTFSELETDVEYSFRVQAGCEGAWSSIATYTPEYAAPTDVLVSAQDLGGDASWAPVTGATGYQYIVVLKDAAQDWSSPATGTTVSSGYVHADPVLSGLHAKTAYDFYVKAVFAGGTSAATKKSFTTSSHAPNTPTVADGDITSSSAVATWTLPAACQATQCQWICKLTSAGTPADDDAAWSAPTTEFTANISGLDAYTDYTVYVRAYYEDGIYSSNASQTFKTKCGTETLPFSYDFGTSYPSTLSACWKTTYTGSYNWGLDYNWSSTEGYNYFIKFQARANSSYYAILETPSIELSTEAILTFKWKNDYNIATELLISTDGGSTKSSIDEEVDADLSTTTGWANKSVDLSAYVGETVILYFKGTGRSANSKYISLDDINIAAKPCDAPTFTDANVETTATGATISCAADKWNLKYKKTADADIPANWTVISNITEATKAITGDSGTEYEVKVQAVCSATRSSDWTASQTFTPVNCPVPTTLGATAITHNSVTISWSGDAKTLRYKTGSDDWTNETISPAAETLDLSDLAAESTYTVQVKADCEEGDTWSDALEFTTKCTPISITKVAPYEADFTGLDEVMPACWDKSATTKPYVKNEELLFDGKDQTAILPKFSNATSGLMLKFNYKHSYAASYSGQIQVGYIDASGDFQAFGSALSGATSYTAAEINFDGVDDDEAKYIAIRLIHNNPSNISYANGFIKDVVVELAPTCYAPASIAAATSITATSATLSWTASGKGETQYQWAIAEGSATPAWEAENIVNTTSKGLTGLNPQTDYTFYVRSYCGASDQSEVVSKSFTTKCAAIPVADMPFEESFGSALGACWKTYAASYYSVYISDNELHATASKTSGNESVVVLPGLAMALNQLVVSFDYKGSNGTIEVGYVTDAEDKTTFVAVGSAYTVASAYKQAGTALTSVGDATGNVALRFKGNTGDGEFTVDNLRVAYGVGLVDSENNTSTLSTLTGETLDVVVERTLYCDGDYNTICLPFDLTTLDGTPLAGGELWAFRYGYVENGELLMRVAPASSIAAGVPYLITFTSGANIVNPIFTNVTITKSAGVSVGQTEDVQFIGILKPQPFTENDKNNLFVATGGMLAWSEAETGAANSYLRSFRGYFHTETAVSGTPVSNHMPARIVRGEQVATGFDDVHGDVQSLKLLENGRVVIIRNGVKYSVQGQVISK